ncbi:MAG: BRO family protein [Desulfotomaculales bacterium]
MNQEEMLPVLAQEGDLAVVSVDGQPVVTARALARALGYVDERSVLRIYNRNKESFRERDHNSYSPLEERGCQNDHPFTHPEAKYDTGVVTIDTLGGPQQVRYFTKRGALKICMKSNQPMAVQVQEMLIDLYEMVESRRLVPVEAIRRFEARLEELAHEVRRLAEAQETKIVYLPRPFRPKATDDEAVEFLRQLFEAEPSQKTIEAIRKLKTVAEKRGWRVGSQASLYRLAQKVR